MIEKFILRKERHVGRHSTEATRVTDKEHIAMLGKTIKVVKK